MKKNKKIITILSFSLMLIVVVIAAQLLIDWYTFNSQTRNIKNYLSSVEGIDEKKIALDKRCSYSHQKYSKGSLGCGFDYAFSSATEKLIGTNFDSIAKNFGWKFAFDNTEGNNKYSEEKYVLSRVYKYKGLTCGLHIYIIEQGYQYNIGCSGPAKAEWFLVREN